MNTGEKLGHYTVVEKVGAGGMGEVYRATDTKLGRDVALKVLPEAFAQDAQRMQRFQREAQVLASLNHPNIASIYGLEESGTTRALVMELVEGPTLADRIAQGAVPIDEALPIAKQIADALEYAHERGIIHRDLKPANIKLTPDGQAKVLDFGLAKALSEDAAAQDASHSPTLSLAATRAGIILGTAAYMSPEQARGKPVDRRADIWSFGVVLFEMLSGQRAYSGEDISVTLANVIKEDPDWQGLPANTPLRVRNLLRRCLHKDAKRRLQAIGEARIVIEEMIADPAGTSEVAAMPAAGAAAYGAVPLWRRAWPWAALSSVLALALLLAVLGAWRAPAKPTTPLRLSTELGADVSLNTNAGSSGVLSPDGTVLVFRARTPTAGTQLYVRKLDQLQATPLAGTDGARNQFFSPDGQWIAFFSDGKLKKISVSGGAAITLCDAPNDRGGWWAEDGTIVFTADTREGLSRVSSAGGKPEPLTQLDKAAGEITHRWPQVLPGSKAVLFTAHTTGGNFDEANLVVQVLATGERKIVQRGGFYGRYLPSGHLVYMQQGTLFAAPFDLQRLEVAAQPVPAVEGVTSVSGNAGAQFSFSEKGTLLYAPGADVASNLPILWMDQQGKFAPLRSAPGNYWDLSFSPDGRRLAIEIADGVQRDLWVYEWARDTLTRLTFDSSNDEDAAWTPDSRRIAFASERDQSGISNLYWKRADGTGNVDRLTKSQNNQFQPVWHPSGKFLAFVEIRQQTGPDLMVLPLEGDEQSGWKPGEPSVFLSSSFAEVMPAFSPDGRWLAYMSTESGRPEIYVRPFPGPGGKWQVSTDEGYFPVWSRNGRELFYRSGDQQIWVATYRAVGDSFVADKPRLWSEGQFSPRGRSRNFDLHPDGKRFAVLKASETVAEEKRDKVVLIFNFFDELRRIAPPGGKSTK